MFFQKRGNLALVLAASGICLLSSGASAQENSPYVGDGERARVNEAMAEEAAMMQKTASASAAAKSKSLTINPFPVTSSGQATVPKVTPQPEAAPAPAPVIAQEEAPAPVPAPIVKQETQSAQASPPPDVEEGFEVIDLTVIEQPEDGAPVVPEAMPPEVPQEPVQEFQAPQQAVASASGQDTFDVYIQEERALVQQTASAAPQVQQEQEPVAPDLLVVPPSLYEKRMSPDSLPKPVKIERENNKTISVQSGKVMQGMAPVEFVPAQPVKAEMAMPEAVRSYEPPPEVNDRAWQSDSAPQSIVTKEVEPVYIAEEAPMDEMPVQQPQMRSSAPSERVNWIDPTPVKRWRALRGTTLQEQLAMWAREGGMDFIWDSNRSFIVKETFSMQASYEQALLSLLSQYEGDSFHPTGKVYLDDQTGRRVVVIRAVD